jgi:hypothetical protein
VVVYKQTLKRHRRLLLLPVVLSTLIASWITFGAAPTYRSTTALWVDNGLSVASSLDTSIGTSTGLSADASTGPTGPAALEDEVLGELLTTGDFDLAVAEHSTLPQFIASGASSGGFSPSVLLNRVHHSSGGSPDDTAAVSVGTQVRATVAGPQVLLLSYVGPSPAVAQSVLRSVVVELGKPRFNLQDNIGKAASWLYSHRLSAVAAALANTRAALADYARSHPRANSANDPAYAALAREVVVADTLLESVQVASNAAAGMNVSAPQGAGATLSVVDPPSLPRAQVAGLGSKISGAVAGTFAGLIVSLLVLILVTPRAASPWDADLSFVERLSGPRRSAPRGTA